MQGDDLAEATADRGGGGGGEEDDEVFEVNEPKNKKQRKSYDDAGRSTKFAMLHAELVRLATSPAMQEDLLVRLEKEVRGRKRSRNETAEVAADFFDHKLSCMNIISEANISLAKWDSFRLWARDYHARGGDLLALPSRKTLAEYRDANLVPPGLLCSATTTRLPMQYMFDHTAERMAKRPDVRTYLEQQKDGARLEFVWKWGVDGQTGFASYNRQKEHDDRQCLNEGAALIMVTLIFIIPNDDRSFLRAGLRTPRRCSSPTTRPAASTSTGRWARLAARRRRRRSCSTSRGSRPRSPTWRTPWWSVPAARRSTSATT